MAHLIAECRIRETEEMKYIFFASLSFDNGKYYNIIFNISARNVMLYMQRKRLPYVRSDKL